MFLLSNLRKTGIAYQEAPYYGEYLGAFSSPQQMLGVFAHYWNGNIMAYASNTEALEQLVEAFKHGLRRPIAGVVGENQIAQHIISRLGLLQNDYAINHTETLYALPLDELRYDIGADDVRTQFAHVSEIDHQLLFQWFKAYEIEALGREDSAELDQHINVRTADDVDQWVLVINGTPVSLSGFNARLPDIVQVGPVWTTPQFRNKGYAKRLLAWTLYQAKRQGVSKSILFTNNPPAANAYQSLGFHKIGLFRLALLKAPCFPN